MKNYFINPLNAELNPICLLLALLGAHHILHVNSIRVYVLLLCEMLPKMRVPKLLQMATPAM